ncbi:MAG: hypothetical protein P8J61_08720 [Gammaproteobacteria bacterium]|jgi:hypothetical protein|nr:hypothetical protein [Gammaproteobacteria bacterium]
MKTIFKAVLAITILNSSAAIHAQEETVTSGGGSAEALATSSLTDFELGDEQMDAVTGMSSAPVDLTGTWVSIVNEDWRFRMVTPQIGDLANIPENEVSREYAMNWTPEMDQGNECRAYGAPAIMHEPGRIKISWEDDVTLKLELDAGHQTRYFHFDPNVESGAPSRQGHSFAQWESPRGAQVAAEVSNVVPIGMQFPRPEMVSNALQVVTNNLIPGYLRKNGIQHSGQTEYREYFNLITIANGTSWLVVDGIVEDPVYLSTDWVTSMNFKKEPDDSKWNPQDCFVTNPGW